MISYHAWENDVLIKFDEVSQENQEKEKRASRASRSPSQRLKWLPVKRAINWFLKEKPCNNRNKLIFPESNFLFYLLMPFKLTELDCTYIKNKKVYHFYAYCIPARNIMICLCFYLFVKKENLSN